MNCGADTGNAAWPRSRLALAVDRFVLLMLAGGIASRGHALYTYDTLAKQASARLRGTSQCGAAVTDRVAHVEAAQCRRCAASFLRQRHRSCRDSRRPHRRRSSQVNPFRPAPPPVAATWYRRPSASYAFQPWMAIPDGLWLGLMHLSFGPIQVTMPRTS